MLEWRPLTLRDRLVAGRLSLEQKALVRIQVPRPYQLPIRWGLIFLKGSYSQGKLHKENGTTD